MIAPLSPGNIPFQPIRLPRTMQRANIRIHPLSRALARRSTSAVGNSLISPDAGNDLYGGEKVGIPPAQAGLIRTEQTKCFDGLRRSPLGQLPASIVLYTTQSRTRASKACQKMSGLTVEQMFEGMTTFQRRRGDGCRLQHRKDEDARFPTASAKAEACRCRSWSRSRAVSPSQPTATPMRSAAGPPHYCTVQ